MGKEGEGRGGWTYKRERGGERKGRERKEEDETH